MEIPIPGRMVLTTVLSLSWKSLYLEGSSHNLSYLYNGNPYTCKDGSHNCLDLYNGNPQNSKDGSHTKKRPYKYAIDLLNTTYLWLTKLGSQCILHWQQMDWYYQGWVTNPLPSCQVYVQEIQSTLYLHAYLSISCSTNDTDVDCKN